MSFAITRKSNGCTVMTVSAQKFSVFEKPEGTGYMIFHGEAGDRCEANDLRNLVEVQTGNEAIVEADIHPDEGVIVDEL